MVVGGRLVDPRASRAVLDREVGKNELAPLKNVFPALRTIPLGPPWPRKPTLLGGAL